MTFNQCLKLDNIDMSQHQPIVRYLEVVEARQVSYQSVLIHYFLEWQREKNISGKIIRCKCKTKEQAVPIAVEGRNIYEKIQYVLLGSKYGLNKDQFAKPHTAGKVDPIGNTELTWHFIDVIQRDNRLDSRTSWGRQSFWFFTTMRV